MGFFTASICQNYQTDQSMNIPVEDSPPSTPNERPSHFIRHIIEADLAAGKFAARRWSGAPGEAVLHEQSALDPARIRTRFPPEPNGYLHLGHAKAICLNFGLAQDYGGACHLRFDDTNPEKEEREYVQAIIADLQWLGFSWRSDDGIENLYHASDYFDYMYRAAEYLIASGDAYVDSQSAEEIRRRRGTLTEAGRDSPWRQRSPDENMALFRRMRAGEFADGSNILRAKIDMSSPNLNMRDPAIYRIRRATHHNTGDKWCIYPMYTFAHPIEDALENITHSICTLEFEDQRPFYDWLLAKLATGGLIQRPPPQQIEFSRLNLDYTVLSKRQLAQLVEGNHVSGWDDPRMPTILGARRRGYTAEGLRRFAECTGITKSVANIEFGLLEECMREHLNETAPRRVAVLNPLKLVINNYPAGQSELCQAPNHPHKPEWGKRDIPFAAELLIEREDFMATPSKGFHRLSPGSLVRLRYAYVVCCTGFDSDASGEVSAVYCDYLPETRSGTPGADSIKVKGNLHWLANAHSCIAKVRLYDRLFLQPSPGTRHSQGQSLTDNSFLDDLNPDSVREINVRLEPALKDAQPEERFQFERHGYFVVDQHDSKEDKPVFNRTVTLKDSWGRQSAGASQAGKIKGARS